MERNPEQDRLPAFGPHPREDRVDLLDGARIELDLARYLTPAQAFHPAAPCVGQHPPLVDPASVGEGDVSGQSGAQVEGREGRRNLGVIERGEVGSVLGDEGQARQEGRQREGRQDAIPFQRVQVRCVKARSERAPLPRESKTR